MDERMVVVMMVHKTGGEVGNGGTHRSILASVVWGYPKSMVSSISS